MPINIIKCDENDYQRITDFYKYVIDNTNEMENMLVGNMDNTRQMK